ncbi:MAG: ATP-dependent helicase [Deltaproteobacteria bacterium]|jgi:DNA helicase-2/ATP-dependent DNA helicase PcrA|nr:ATP-dependent helicase [Deltaproteobacteria bacterium]
MNLSAKQREIVNRVDTPLLVKGLPGCGKTRALTERVKRLLAESKRGKVLVLTLSGLAAAETRLRLGQDAQVSQAPDRLKISTIHSFALDLLSSRGYLIGLRPDLTALENDHDRLAIMRDLILSEPSIARQLTGTRPWKDFITNCLNDISDHKRRLITPEESKIKEPFPYVYRKYNEILSFRNVMDYDDVLFFTYRLLIENPDVAKLYHTVYRHICLDEAQDLNEAQYQVIQALCSNEFNNIMMVSHENQAICTFNGYGGRYIIDNFVNDFSPTIYILDENYRYAKRIINYLNFLTDNEDNLSRYHYEGELNVNVFENEREEAKFVCSVIQNLMANGHDDIEGTLTHDKFAVIARNKYVLASVDSALSEDRIPFYYERPYAGIFSETVFMTAFGYILRLMANSRDSFYLRLLCNLLDKKFLSELNTTNITNVLKELLYETDFSFLAAIIKDIKSDNILNLHKVLDNIDKNMPLTLSDDDKYLLKKDISEWRTHWQTFCTKNPSENRTLVSFRHAIALGKTQKSDSNSGVALLTAPMSKGLEFEVVFVIGLSEGTFPDYRAMRRGPEAMTQEKNIMRAAVGRAKRICHLSYPKLKLMPWGDYQIQRPSRFIGPYVP